MSLRDEINNGYIDGNDLVSPELVTPGTKRASDNGVLYSSEYYILLKLNNELILKDYADYRTLIQTCIGLDGFLHRAPDDISQDEIDDHIGSLAAHNVLGLYPRFNIPFALWRFPQLFFTWLLVRGYNRLLYWPLELITALIIAISSYNRPLTDTDSRTLAWLLIHATDRSWVCKEASKIWYRRLYKDYGSPNAMKSVASRYFPVGHPFRQFWKD